MTTSDRFPTCLAFTLQEEGGKVNNPADPGGATNKGITHATYTAWRTQQGLPIQSVALMADAEVQAIYQAGFWDANQCASLPAPVDACVFDFAVNAGSHSAKVLQTALGVTADGSIGPATLAAANAADPQALASELLALRESYYQQIAQLNPSLAVFLAGWLNRVQALRQFISTP